MLANKKMTNDPEIICICIYIAGITAIRRNTPASQARGAAAAGYITLNDPSHLTFAHLSASVL